METVFCKLNGRLLSQRKQKHNCFPGLFLFPGENLGINSAAF